MNRRRITDMVQQILDQFDINSGPVDVEAICSNLGIEIKRGSFEDTLSGFAYQKKGRKVIGVNAEDGALRQRFTIAHELGHLHLDPRDNINYDETFAMQFRDGVSSQGTNLKEIEANFFAAELLMPAAFIKADLQKIISKHGGIDFEGGKEVEKLAKKYQVSQHAMTVRLTKLHFI